MTIQEEDYPPPLLAHHLADTARLSTVMSTSQPHLQRAR